MPMAQVEKEQTAADILTELTPMQQEFIRNYVDTGNATKSALAAGYSAKNAHVQGHTLLKHPKVLKCIRLIKQEIVDELQTQFLDDAKQARLLLRDMMDDKDMPSSLRAMIAKDFLDRAGFKAVEKKEVHQENSGEVKVVFNIPRPPLNTKEQDAKMHYEADELDPAKMEG